LLDSTVVDKDGRPDQEIKTWFYRAAAKGTTFLRMSYIPNGIGGPFLVYKIRVIIE
jgi:hypothetical protein